MRSPVALLIGALTLAACAREGARSDTANARDTVGRADTSMMGAAPAGSATAAMTDTRGRDLGTLTLSDTTDGIRISGSLGGLPPGEHGIHLHTTGRCDPPFESAGGHWNPAGRQHGFDNPQGHHLGDMLNVAAGNDSSANVRLTTRGGSLRGANALLDADGAAIVVHARADDYRTDPSGNSGDRIACGVVTAR
jgi:Cu-Zn family superoxide dismutase